jgi:hypothetical protein
MTRFSRISFMALAASPFILAAAQSGTQEKTAEQVFKNITVFKGVPASDLIPSMEFMAASLKYECSDCHNPQDYAADTRAKETTRHMVLMQRDINTKNFNGRNQVTCMTCHRGSERPVGTPIPDGVSLRHKRLDNAPKPEDLFAKHLALASPPSSSITKTGTLTAPNDATHKVETKPLVFVQRPGGKFSLSAGERKVVSDGTAITYGGYPMTDEPGAMFSRIGRSWNDADFKGISQARVVGQDTVGKANVVVVQGQRQATTSTEELSFDQKSNILLRLVNVKRSSLGNVVMAIDYSNYKMVGNVKTPMKVVVTFAGGEQWIMDFKTAKVG